MSKIGRASFPTELHRQTAELVRGSFAPISAVDTFLVVNSCARGQAVPESDLDFAVLVTPNTTPTELAALEQSWQTFSQTNPEVLHYKGSHRFASIHLDIIVGRYVSSLWDDGGGPDYFEVEIGNQLAYSAPMGDAGVYFQQLRERWLPYYDEVLREQRFLMARQACAYDLEHIPFYLNRGLYFQAFDRLYKAFQEFLQALFIGHRTYPIAYNKWIKEQIVNFLNLPDLYEQLPSVISVSTIEGTELKKKAELLQELVDVYCIRT